MGKYLERLESSSDPLVDGLKIVDSLERIIEAFRHAEDLLKGSLALREKRIKELEIHPKSSFARIDGDSDDKGFPHSFVLKHGKESRTYVPGV